jgi:Phage tail tube protein
MMMVGGAVLYNGLVIGYMSNATLSISSPAQADPMIGLNYAPAVFLGTLSVTGSFNLLTTAGIAASDTFTNDFLNEAEVSLQLLLATANNPSAGFISFYLPRVKLGAATKQDSPTAITRAITFQALENTTVAQADDATLVIADSAA